MKCITIQIMSNGKVSTETIVYLEIVQPLKIGTNVITNMYFV